MKNNSNLIVMLTYNDFTVMNAGEIFEKCKNSKAKFWGFKDKGLPFEEMKELFRKMKSFGKTTFLEVVTYTESESLEGAKLAFNCGCDILMGTMFFDSVNDFCKENNLLYMPFVGKIKNRPSILEGSINEIINEANTLIEKGVYGFDLLAYRYTGDTEKLITEFVKSVKAKVCIAGSIDSYNRIDSVINSKAWAFTIGSAFFDNKFGNDFLNQVDCIIDYIQ